MKSSAKKIYDFLVEYSRANGYPPTRREIAAAVSKAHSNVAYHLKTLESLGYIRLGPTGRIAVIALMDEVKQLRAANAMLEHAARMHKNKADWLESQLETQLEKK